MKKNPKTLRIILLIIAAIIGVTSISACTNTDSSVNYSTSVNYSEFQAIVSKAAEKQSSVLTYDEIKEMDGADVIKSTIGSAYVKAEISSVLFDGYVVDFAVQLYNSSGSKIGVKAFTTNYSRQDVVVLQEKLDAAGIGYDYTDPNAG